MNPQSPTPSFLDHLLSGCSAMLALYSVGLGVHSMSFALTMPLIVVGGILTSYGLTRALRGTKVIRWDGAFYALTSLASIFFLKVLNGYLPNGGFEVPLMYTGAFVWMLTLGSFFAWRDATLLFQSVPCITLFALVGSWDTFKASTWLFFLFVLCVSTLYARAHLRSMVFQAEQAGFHQVEELERGPWKWMAGPGWALASGFVVILISLLGAPYIQRSVEGVSKAVQVNIPRPPVQPPQQLGASDYGQNPTEVRIGQGPVQFQNTPVLRAKMDRPRYLRSAAYSYYDAGQWRMLAPNRTISDTRQFSFQLPQELSKPYEPSDIIKGGEKVPYTIEILYGQHGRYYLPGEVLEPPRGGPNMRMLSDGTLLAQESLNSSISYRGVALSFSKSSPPIKIDTPPAGRLGNSARFLDVRQLAPEVRSLAERVTRTARNDYEKALAIKGEIEKRCRYNLNVGPIPTNKDPVKVFLFETQEGYCDLFASSMAIMARSVGLPARVAIGFFPNDPKRDPEGFFVARDADYHMWAEVFFEGFGWVPFDPTEGAVAVDGSKRGSVQTGWRDIFKKLFSAQVLEWIFIGCILVVGFIAFRGLLMHAPTKQKQQKTRIGRLYVKFQKMLERKIGRPRRFGQTPREFATLAGEQFESKQKENVLELTKRFEEALYSSREPSDQEFRELAGAIREFRKAPQKLSVDEPEKEKVTSL